jgi:hypothetical protein
MEPGRSRPCAGAARARLSSCQGQWAALGESRDDLGANGERFGSTSGACGSALGAERERVARSRKSRRADTSARTFRLSDRNSWTKGFDPAYCPARQGVDCTLARGEPGRGRRVSTTPQPTRAEQQPGSKPSPSLGDFVSFGNQKHLGSGQYSHAKPLKSGRIPVGQYWANFGTIGGQPHE